MLMRHTLSGSIGVKLNSAFSNNSALPSLQTDAFRCNVNIHNYLDLYLFKPFKNKDSNLPKLALYLSN